VVVDRREQVAKRGVEGVPLLVIEVLSPSTREHDRSRKAKRYAALGVPHCWLVDPDARRIECFRLEGPRYVLATRGAGSAAVSHPDFPGLTLDLAPL